MSVVSNDSQWNLLSALYQKLRFTNRKSPVRDAKEEMPAMQIFANGHGGANQSIELGPELRHSSWRVQRVKGGGVIIPSHKYMRRCLQLAQTTQHNLR